MNGVLTVVAVNIYCFVMISGLSNRTSALYILCKLTLAIMFDIKVAFSVNVYACLFLCSKLLLRFL